MPPEDKPEDKRGDEREDKRDDKRLLGHRFADASLLARALTHRSASHHNNERLEFLGDALLNLIVAELVFERQPKADEGEMTRARAALVNGAALADLARRGEIGEHLTLGPGELKSGGFRRDSILADAFEAIVAAVYLDAGWQACRELVRAQFATQIGSAAHVSKDPKTRLQEWLQSRDRRLPSYDVIAIEGSEHARTFDIVCRIDELHIETRGSAGSRRAAEQKAAEHALARLESSDRDER